jgi:hypothetical protein
MCKPPAFPVLPLGAFISARGAGEVPNELEVRAVRERGMGFRSSHLIQKKKINTPAVENFVWLPVGINPAKSKCSLVWLMQAGP